MRALVRRYLFNRIERKFVAGILLVVLVPLLTTALYGQFLTSRILSEQAITAVQADLNQRASRIETYLAGVRDDVLYLANLDSLQALLAARQRRDPQAVAYWREQVAQEFATFGRTHPEYYQLRYLGEEGLEIVRVNVRYGQVEIVPPAQLQPKRHRYYFLETMRLPRGVVYVSPVDLNREFGQIEIPYTPVVRYATPVFYPDGQRAGIVILNLYAAEFLQYVTEGQRTKTTALADQDGYYMIHPDPTKTWGHPWDLAHNYRVQVEFPRHWPQILRPSPGVISEGGQVIVHVPVFPNADNPERYWVLLHVEPRATLFASVYAFRTTAAGILIVALFAAWMLAMFLARQITVPILQLSEAVRRFASERRYRPVEVRTHDELAMLAKAFNETAQTLEMYMARLSRLHHTGRTLAACLRRDDVLEQALTAALSLLPARAAALILAENGRWPERPQALQGEPAWQALALSRPAQTIREAVVKERTWQLTRISGPDGSVAYLCSAPLISPRGQVGTLEIYGADPRLRDSATGHVLGALAMQAAVALDNAELYARLQRHQQQLQALVERLIQAQEEERRRIAYDLHDGLIQRLVGVRLQLSQLLHQETLEDEHHLATLEKAVVHLKEAIQEARRLLEGLRPALLDELGLVPAVEALLYQLAAEAGWEVQLDVPDTMPRLSGAVEIAAFRIVQEALNNVYKHARASHVRLRMKVTDTTLTVEVQDNGRGFDPTHVNTTQHLGLIGMKERAQLLGGTCTVTSRPGEGTTVRAVLPLDDRRWTVDDGR